MSFTPIPDGSPRPTVKGKFLSLEEQRFWVKGVTYGTFRPRPDGAQYPEDDVIASDFTAIAAAGFNTVRTYTAPPRSLLDIAQSFGLRVMVGLAWAQHVTFLDDAKLVRQIRESVREGTRGCAGHPAVLCYAVGNEIPASVVRWHGRRKIEKFVEELYLIVKSSDAEAMVTYVNFPTTEYLRLPFLDFTSFNVYLECREKLENYLARLHNLSEERPLVLAEVGLDSRRNGVRLQAESLDWQLSSAFGSGCAGAIVFGWTDEWYRGGADIDDWDFGLSTRGRAAKPALDVVRRRLVDVPFGTAGDLPRVSVVVCSLNGSATIRDTLEALTRLEYPNYEVIVIDDGSTDETPVIANEYPFRVISTENRGLSNARNLGWQQATGDIVAYIDDDAYPDPQWLSYLVQVFQRSDFVGVGGPNLAPAGDGWIADCVANSPGGPVHVLVSDTEAEHIPGCNMAFRRDALSALNGFDPIFRAAGDDVDICWRLQDRRWKIGFSAAAVVWHHRRDSLSMYWKQQKGYGKAEALLERKWPERYNTLGHLSWKGKLYGKGLTRPLALPGRIYSGPFGSGPFQSIYDRSSNGLASYPLMPEWFLLIALLAAFAAIGFFWAPLSILWPLLAAAAALPVAQAIMSATRAEFPSGKKSRIDALRKYAVTAALHLVQPIARLIGRLQHGLRPWRTRSESSGAGLVRQSSVWMENWRDPQALMHELVQAIKSTGRVVACGGDFDDWDIEIRGGLLGSARVRMVVEEHGAGKQLYRFRVTPRVTLRVGGLLMILAALAIAAAFDGAWIATALLAGGASVLAYGTYLHVRSAALDMPQALSRRSSVAQRVDTVVP